MKTDCYTYTDENGNEVRYMLSHGLICPNPREYHQTTRSYESLRAEYDLLHGLYVTEEDIMKAISAMRLL